MIIMKSAIIKYFSGLVFTVPISMFLFISNSYCQKKYTLNYILAGKDTLYKLPQLELTTSFDGKESAIVYVSLLPKTLLAKGFPAASVDSASYDSTSANINLYFGEQYKWVQINTDSIDNKLLDATGWNARQFKNKKIDFARLQQQEEK